MREQFAEEGFLGPIRVLSAHQCERFLAAVDEQELHRVDWPKSFAVTSRPFYEIATHPSIADLVAELLGGDVMLWGTSIQQRGPGAVHAWHCDIESSGPAGRTVSVWLGLEHATSASALLLIPYSHRFGATVQEVRSERGKGRDATSDADVESWARSFDERSEVLRPDLTDGDALFFDGRLWHGSRNRLDRTRRALLLQYATPDTEIYIPDLKHLEWPFRQLSRPRPPCLMIRGRARAVVNRFVRGPIAPDPSDPKWQLTSRIYPLRIPLDLDGEKGWTPHHIFRGATPSARTLSCHASVLAPGHSPHPPHAHEEEELLLLLSGEVDLILPAAGGGKRLQPWELVYYPAGFPHTLETVSKEPANYLMLKWRADSGPPESGLGYGHFETFRPDADVEDGFRPRLLFQGSTAYLRNLHCHATTLTPGAGYEPHVDAYDVVIVVLEGEVETLGERVGPHGVIFYAAGEPHGMSNPGAAVARYLVFELHGRPPPLPGAP